MTLFLGHMAKSKHRDIDRVIRVATKAGFRTEIIPLERKIVIYTDLTQNEDSLDAELEAFEARNEH